MIQAPRRSGWTWHRVATAASILLIFGASNFIIFHIGQSGAQSVDGIDHDISPPRGIVAMPANLRRETRERWRDHIDYTNVTLHQLARLGAGEVSEGNELAEAKLALLRADDLGDAKRNDFRALDGAAPYANEYLRLMRNLTASLNVKINKEPGRSTASFLRSQKREITGLANVMRHLWAELRREAEGSSWNRRARKPSPAHKTFSPEIRALLDAETPFFSADYSTAERGYRAFGSRQPRSKLQDIASFMLCETLGRLQKFREAEKVAIGMRPRTYVLGIPSIAYALPGRRSIPTGAILTFTKKNGYQFILRSNRRLPGLTDRSGVMRIEVTREAPALPAPPAKALKPLKALKKSQKKL